MLFEKSHFYNSKNIDSSLFYMKQALDICRKLNDTQNLVKSQYNIAKLLIRKNEYEEAKEYLLEIVNLSKHNRNNYYIRNTYTQLGIIEDNNNNPDGALNYYNKALLYADSPKDKIFINNNISGCLFLLGKKELALNYLQESFDLYKDKSIVSLDHDSKKELLVLYNNLAIYKEPSEKIEILKKALNLALSDTRLEYNLPLVYSSLGIAFSKVQNRDSAFYFLKKALKIGRNINFNEEIVINSFLISYKALEFNEPELSLKYLDSTILFLDNKKDKIILNKHLDSLAFEIYKINGQYSEAVKSAAIYIKYQDSMLMANNQSSLLEFAQKYETEKKIQENELLKKDIQIKELSLSKEKTGAICYLR